MGLCFGCFAGGNTKHMTKEEERLASEEAKARAEEKRLKEGDNSATDKQNQGKENQSSNPDAGIRFLDAFNEQDVAD